MQKERRADVPHQDRAGVHTEEIQRQDDSGIAVLGAGVVMLSIWAPPVMTAEELARLPGHARPSEDAAPRPQL